MTTGTARLSANQIALGYQDFVESLTLPGKSAEEMIVLGYWWQGEPIAEHDLDSLVGALNSSANEKLLAEAYHRARFYFAAGNKELSTDERRVWLNRLFNALAANLDRLSPTVSTPRIQRRRDRSLWRRVFG